MPLCPGACAGQVLASHCCLSIAFRVHCPWEVYNSEGLLNPSLESMSTLMCNMLMSLLRRNMPAHTAPVDKLYEALVHGTSGMQQAFGVPNGFHLFARPEVGWSFLSAAYISIHLHPVCTSIRLSALLCAMCSELRNVLLHPSWSIRARPF
jgi:hypothetical protein